MRRNVHIGAKSENDAPNGYLAEQVILLLELLHLAVPNGAVLGVHEILLDFMPRSYILATQRDLHPIDGHELPFISVPETEWS
jgi:hypothetical protein